MLITSLWSGAAEQSHDEEPDLQRMQVPEPDDGESDGARAAITDPVVAEIQPAIPPFINTSFTQPLERHWQPDGLVLGTPLVLLMAEAERRYPVPVALHLWVREQLRLTG